MNMQGRKTAYLLTAARVVPSLLPQHLPLVGSRPAGTTALVPLNAAPCVVEPTVAASALNNVCGTPGHRLVAARAEQPARIWMMGDFGWVG